MEFKRKNNSGSLTNNYNNDRCSWGAIKRFWNYGMDFSKCDNNNNNNNFSNRKNNNKSKTTYRNNSSLSKYKSAKESPSTKTLSSKYYSAKLKQSL